MREETSLKLEYIGVTDRGKIREKNEDAFCIDENYYCGYERKKLFRCVQNIHHIFGVFDGVGGDPNGELASAAAAEYFASVFGQPITFSEESILHTFYDANEYVEKKANHSCTTAVIVIIKGMKARIAYTGDSRAYLLRDHELLLFTQDHTFIYNEEGEEKKCITRFLGECSTENWWKPNLSQWIDLKPHDLFLLCSDGLTDEFNEEKIRVMLEKTKNLSDKKIIQRWAERAAKGRDNVTIVIAQVCVE